MTGTRIGDRARELRRLTQELNEVRAPIARQDRVIELTAAEFNATIADLRAELAQLKEKQ